MTDVRRPTVRRAARVALGTLAAGALGAGCGDATSGEAPIARVELSTSAVAVVAGADAPVTARLLAADGRELAGRSVVWTTRDAAVADVAHASGLTGVVRGRTPGTTQVAANAEGRSAVATVTVSPRAVAAVAAEPATLDLRVGGTRQLRVRALDAAGAELEGRAITLASSDTTVATVTAAGLVAGVAPGGATITAASEGHTALVAVTVTPVPVASVALAPDDPSVVVGGTVQFTATALDSAGRPLADRVATWTSSDDAVARVSSTGLATGVRPGTARVAVAVGGRSASRTLTVLARPVAAVALAAPRTTLAVGETAQLTTRLTDAGGNVLADRAVRYESDAPAVATVSATGLVTAVAPGAATVAATSEGVRGALAFTVIAVPVASVAVTPATAELRVGRTVRLTATPRAADGAPLAGRAVAWTSGAPGIAAVSAEGVATGVAPGTAVIFARSEGAIGQATIVVTVAGRDAGVRDAGVRAAGVPAPSPAASSPRLPE